MSQSLRKIERENKMAKSWLESKKWDEESSSVWKEIVSRWGKADYEDETKRTEHKATLKLEWDAQAYARSRQAEYPPLADQLDHIYHNGVESWKTNVVKPVKDKYPKPG